MRSEPDMTSREWRDASSKLLQDPNNFSFWQSLIHAAEDQEILYDKTQSISKLKSLRKSYRAFLEKFPLAVSYWIAFARWEMKLGSCELSDSIYLEGLSYVEYDLNLWVEYLRFKLETITDNIQPVLKLFEKARMKIGNHYHSYDFYRLYISFLKTYSTKENKFHEKLLLLLRLIMDIPLYSYAALFKEIIEMLSNARLSLDSLNNFAGESTLTELMSTFGNKKQSVLDYIRSLVEDAYVANQFKSLLLFTFEKELGNKCLLFDQEYTTLAQLEAWISYLNFAEQTYPFSYVIQLYERCLIANFNHVELANKYVDFIINFGKFSYARNVLRKLISTSIGSDCVTLFLRLADLEVTSGHATHAKDMIVRYISHNSEVPNSIYNKLIDVEILITNCAETRICSLVHHIILTTCSTYFFKKISRLHISKAALHDFYSHYLMEDSTRPFSLVELKSNKEFMDGAKKYCLDSDLQKLSII